jgi:hypothetical protein
MGRASFDSSFVNKIGCANPEPLTTKFEQNRMKPALPGSTTSASVIAWVATSIRTRVTDES